MSHRSMQASAYAMRTASRLRPSLQIPRSSRLNIATRLYTSGHTHASSQRRVCQSFTRLRPVPTTLRRAWPRGKRWNGSGPPEIGSIKAKAVQKTMSMSQRFKELSRKYGWTAVGVYLALSVLDFPLCFLAVRMLGPDRVGEAEQYIVQNFRALLAKILPRASPGPAVNDKDIAKASPSTTQHSTGASIWTQLLLAYGVHKSLIFFRVPLAAAVTPRIATYLRARGWKVGNTTAT